jgi:hypothetical protein
MLGLGAAAVDQRQAGTQQTVGLLPQIVLVEKTSAVVYLMGLT